MRKLSAVVISLVLAAAAAPALLGASADSQLSEQLPQTEAAVATVQTPTRAQSSTRLLAAHSGFLVRKIVHHQRATWRWQELMGKARTKPGLHMHEIRTKAYRTWVLRLWRKRHHQARRQAMNPPHRSAWLCIQRYEGSWRDGGGPYYGGLQMDVGFMSRYGNSLLRRKGTADNWSPLEQMWVGERALRAGRGFYPWPNAARLCGLI
jgi:hypothetical protein